MLTLTDRAAEVVRVLADCTDDPDQAGLRIAPRPRENSGALTLAVTVGPGMGDQVVETKGVRIFVAPLVAAALDDKSLDIGTRRAGTMAFLIRRQRR